MAIVTVFYECKGGPADGEVVEIPASLAEVVLVHDGPSALDLYHVGPWVERDRHGRVTGTRNVLWWAGVAYGV
jgi:hypothetical protein